MREIRPGEGEAFETAPTKESGVKENESDENEGGVMPTRKPIVTIPAAIKTRPVGDVRVAKEETPIVRGKVIPRAIFSIEN